MPAGVSSSGFSVARSVRGQDVRGEDVQGNVSVSSSRPPEHAAEGVRTRILLVDDSSTARHHVREALSATMATQFTEASEGREALWKAKSSRHDLVITDLHMPTMDGLAFVRQLRELPEYATVPILILTSDPTRERLKEGRKAGASGWLVKPTAPEALVTTVRHALFERR